MARLARSMYMNFVSYDGKEWEVLGKDNDDASKELNPDTESSKNVLDETTFTHSGYEPEFDLDPYYADESSILYDKLTAAALKEGHKDEDVKGYFLEVLFKSEGVDEKAGTLTGVGYKREAYIVPQSIGGDTTAVSIPFNVNPVGPQTEVSVTYTRATRAVTVTTATSGGSSTTGAKTNTTGK